MDKLETDDELKMRLKILAKNRGELSARKHLREE